MLQCTSFSPILILFFFSFFFIIIYIHWASTTREASSWTLDLLGAIIMVAGFIPGCSPSLFHRLAPCVAYCAKFEFHLSYKFQVPISKIVQVPDRVTRDVDCSSSNSETIQWMIGAWWAPYWAWMAWVFHRGYKWVKWVERQITGTCELERVSFPSFSFF